MKSALCCIFIVAVSVSVVSIARADAATLLQPISDLQHTTNNSQRVFSAVDDSGTLMSVYWAQAPDKVWRLYSTLTSGGDATTGLVPLHSDMSGATFSVTICDLTAGKPSHGFHMVGRRGDKTWYWHWSNGAWTPPAVVVECPASGTHNWSVAVRADGSPVITHIHGKLSIYALSPTGWTGRHLESFDFRRAGHVSQHLYTSPNGDVHAIGTLHGKCPRLASLPAGVIPLQSNQWSFSPASETNWQAMGDAISSVSSAGNVEHCLDIANGRIYEAWTKAYQLYFASAPIGATSSSQWSIHQVPIPEGAKIAAFSLRASSTGAVGLLYYYRHGKPVDPYLELRWLTSQGASEAIAISRPGTQTEASVFTSFAAETLSMDVTPGGVAHVALVGKKRGEVPAAIERLYCSKVTGGAVSGGGYHPPDTPDEPDNSDNSDKPDEPGNLQNGLKPDFTCSIMSPAEGFDEIRIGTTFVSVKLAITNQGAEYYGDLYFDTIIDGVTTRCAIKDTSNHRAPLFKRGETRNIYPLRMIFNDDYDPGYTVPDGLYESPSVPQLLRFGTGLGRKLMTVRLDPQNSIAEADEQNNTAAAEFIVRDGRDQTDRERVDNRVTRFGLNDLRAVLAPPRSNTELWLDGYAQRPTEVEAMILNPRLAGFFRDVPIKLLLDGRVLVAKTLECIDRPTNITTEELHWLDIDGDNPTAKASGYHFAVPLDLTKLSVGEHMLELQADPDDRYADIIRDNNIARVPLRILPPGGTLELKVLDLRNKQPIAGAHVTMDGLFYRTTDSNGIVTVRDIPAGTYPGSRLVANRIWGQPPYAEKRLAGNIIIEANRTTPVVLYLEGPVTCVGTIKDATTGQPVAGDPVWAHVKNSGQSDSGTDPQYRIKLITPGTQTIQAGAYGFVDAEMACDVHGTSENAEFRQDFTLQRAPRTTIVGTVTDTDGHSIPGADIWMSGAPRWAETSAQGTYQLDDVACIGKYAVWAQKKGYAPQSAIVTGLQQGATRTVNFTLPRVTSRFKSIDVECCAWAEFEEFPGISVGSTSLDSYEVSAKHGNFKVSMAATYNTIEGQNDTKVGQLIVATEGLAFWESNVKSSWDPLDMFSGAIDAVKTGLSETSDVLKYGIKGYGYFAKACTGINKVYNFVKGELDPQEAYEGQVYGAYTSQTGMEPERSALISLPSTELDIAMGFHGGQTVVRVDRVEVTDGTKTIPVHRQWYSPQMCVYTIDDTFDLDALEVRLYVQVLNDRLGVGPLFACSRNVITWKPNSDHYLNMVPTDYSVTP